MTRKDTKKKPKVSLWCLFLIQNRWILHRFFQKWYSSLNFSTGFCTSRSRCKYQDRSRCGCTDRAPVLITRAAPPRPTQPPYARRGGHRHARPMRAAAAAVTAGGLGNRMGLGVIPRHTQNDLSHFVQCALARALFGSAAFCLASHRSAQLRGVPSRLPPLQNSRFVQSGSVPRLGGLHPCARPPPASPHPTALRSAGGLPLSEPLITR